MKTKNQIFSIAKVIILALVLTVGIQYVAAQQSWSPPVGTPPANNTYAPINVGTDVQYKSGGLGVGWGVTQASGIGLLVKNGAVGFGTSAPNPTSRLTVVGGDGDEIARFDSRAQRASSYLKIWNDSGTNLFGVNTAGAWVGPDGNNSMSLKTNNLVRLKVMNGTGYVGIGPDVSGIDPSTNLDVNGQIRVRGVASALPTPGKVLTAVDSTGLATWQTPDISTNPTATPIPPSVETGVTDSSLDSWFNSSAFPSDGDDFYTASCPAGKTLVSCTGGAVSRNDGPKPAHLIIPNTSNNSCKMYVQGHDLNGPVSQQSTAIRLYAMCI